MDYYLYNRSEYYYHHYDYISAIFHCERLLAFIIQPTTGTATATATATTAVQSNNISNSIINSILNNNNNSNNTNQHPLLIRTILLLSNLYYRSYSNCANRAYTILKQYQYILDNNNTADINQSTAIADYRYFYAYCAFELELFTESESILLTNNNTIDNNTNNNSTVPNGGANGYYLLGRICQLTGRRTESIEYYRQSLLLDPLLWASYQSLADLGEAGQMNIEQLFNIQIDENNNINNEHNNTATSAAVGIAAETPASNNNIPIQSLNFSGLSHRTPATAAPAGSLLFGSTPSIKQNLFITPANNNSTEFITPPAAVNNTAAATSTAAVNKLSTINSIQSSAIKQRTPQQQRAQSQSINTATSTGARKFPGRLFDSSAKKGSISVSAVELDKELLIDPYENNNQLSDTADIDSSIIVSERERTERKNIRRSNRAPPQSAEKQSKTPRLDNNKFDKKTPITATNNSSTITVNSAVSKAPAANRRNRSNNISSPIGIGTGKHKLAEIAELETPETESNQNEIQYDIEDNELDTDNDIDTEDLTEFTPNTVITVMRILAAAYARSQLYECIESIELLNSLPTNHRNTAFVLSLLGRNEFELIDYSTACNYYQQLIQLYPYISSGLEYYSTALWHLKRSIELSNLAKEQQLLDRYCAISWIILGNCFSLQQDHELALKFFKRAAAINKYSPYAATLTAHEYLANEDFDSAAINYRKAIGLDPRHYNSWYGLGNIYQRQEKYSLSEYHFHRALDINPRSSVLASYLGMVLNANGKSLEALKLFKRAEELSILTKPNSLAKYQKATVYITLQDYSSALTELTELLELVPRESSVHFLMGKIYRKQGKYSEAMMKFITALDLEPKDRNLVKQAIEKLNSINSMKLNNGTDIIINEESDEEL